MLKKLRNLAMGRSSKKEAAEEQTPKPKKSAFQKILTAEGWKRLMMKRKRA